MRYALFAISALAAATAATVSGTSTAAAIEYPYCLAGNGGTFGDCSYYTMAQCRASASGRGLDCIDNPRYTSSQPPRRGSAYPAYPAY